MDSCPAKVLEEGTGWHILGSGRDPAHEEAIEASVWSFFQKNLSLLERDDTFCWRKAGTICSFQTLAWIKRNFYIFWSLLPVIASKTRHTALTIALRTQEITEEPSQMLDGQSCWLSEGEGILFHCQGDQTEASAVSILNCARLCPRCTSNVSGKSVGCSKSNEGFHTQRETNKKKLVEN